MFPFRESVLLACLLSGLPALAEESVPETTGTAATTGPELAVVMGLSADDLLNIRREASPLGRTLGRLPNGTLVDRHECKLVQRYEWCRVETVDGEKLSGWTPARYLFVRSDKETQTGATAAGGDETAATAPGIPVPAPAPRHAEAAPATSAEETALPPGLEARFAGGPPAEPVAGIAGPEPELLALAEEAAAPARDARAPQQPAASPAPGIPVPTPRPGRAGAAAPPRAETQPDDDAPVALAAATMDPVEDRPASAIRPDADEAAPVEAIDEQDRSDRVEMVAAAIPAATAPAAEIPCARYVGQPMGRCPMHVARGGRDIAEVTIIWPDGGSRTIAFRDGEPASANTRGELRVAREGTLNMIRIGAAERFEILDDLVFDE